MKLLAGSMNVEVDEFLHAGYLSAYPRSIDNFDDLRYDQPTVVLVDLPSALALKPITQGAATSEVVAQVPRAPMPTASFALVGDIFMLCVAIVFFTAIGTAYLRRLGRGAGSILCLWLAGPSLLLAGAWAVSAFLPLQEAWRAQRLNSRPPPWLNVPVREYEDPDAATEAILHGLIVNGLIGCSFKAENLAAIQDEIGFPLQQRQWTEGMTYAATSYGRDGWGREFAFEPIDAGRYRIHSAGEDGDFGSADDIVHTTSPGDHYNWEPKVESIYVRQSEGQTAFLVHRVAHRNFKIANANYAQMLTGGDLFDAVSGDRWSSIHDSTLGGKLHAELEQRVGDQASANRQETLFLARLLEDDT